MLPHDTPGRTCPYINDDNVHFMPCVYGPRKTKVMNRTVPTTLILILLCAGVIMCSSCLKSVSRPTTTTPVKKLERIEFLPSV